MANYLSKSGRLTYVPCDYKLNIMQRCMLNYMEVLLEK